VARSIIFILETIYRCFNCEKKIQNRLTFDEVIEKNSTHVSETRCIYELCSRLPDRLSTSSSAIAERPRCRVG